MSAKLILHQKKIFKDSHLLEMKLWEIPKTKKYPDGIRYSLIFIDLKQKKKVLMDNHTPKGHHYHIDDSEFDYQFNGVDQLINDFKSLVQIHLGVKL